MGLFSPQISTKRMVPLCRQLSTAFDAGIPIIQTFEHVASQARDLRVRRVLQKMADDLRHGATLSEAAYAQRQYFSPFFVQLLASGERGGRLDIMLRDLAQYFEDRLAMQRQIRSMMIIPVVYLMAAWYLGTFSLGLLDVVRDAFKGSGGGTAGVFAYFDRYAAFQARAHIVFLVIFIVIVLLARAGLFKYISGALTTFVWPISIVTQKFALARFFRSFALLLGSGLSITKCIESAAAVTANPYIEQGLLKAVPEVREGATLVQAFDSTRQLTATAREMLLVGEQSGNLETSMKKISEYHLAEATEATAMATRVFGFVIFAAVACLIGYIVISFYSNLYGGMMDELGI